MSAFIDFCGIFGFFSAIAQFYKFILPRSFIEILAKGGSYHSSAVIARSFVRNTTGRFFKGSLFSWHNILKMMIISLASLLAFSIIYFISYDKSLLSDSWWKKDNTHLLQILFVFIFFNVITDIVSFAFTVFLLRFCQRSSSFKDIIVFFIVDIVITSYVFSWIMAIPAALTIYKFDTSKDKIRLEATLPPSEYYKNSYSVGILKNTISVEVRQDLDGNTAAYAYFTLNYQARGTQDSILNSEKIVLENLSIKIEERLSNYRVGIRNYEVKEVLTKEPMSLVNKIIVYYTSGYQFSIKSIESFGTIMLLKDPIIRSIGNSFDRVMFSDKFINSWYLYCDGKYLEEDIVLTNNCKDFFAISKNDILYMESFIKNQKYRGFSLPVAVFFWTSLSATIILYVVMIMTVAGRSIYLIIQKKSLDALKNSNGEKIFVRSMLISGFFLSFIFTIIKNI